MTTRVPTRACLACGQSLNAAAAVAPAGAFNTEPIPRRGDRTLCIRCGHLMIFTRGLRLRNPTPAELAEASHDQLIRDATAAIGELRKTFGSKPQ